MINMTSSREGVETYPSFKGRQTRADGLPLGVADPVDVATSVLVLVLMPAPSEVVGVVELVEGGFVPFIGADEANDDR